MKSYTNSCETIKSSQSFLSDGNNETSYICIRKLTPSIKIYAIVQSILKR